MVTAKWLWFVLMLTLLAAGCQQAQPKQSDAALRQWNAARAGVLGGLAKSQYESGNLEKSRQTIGEALRMDPGNAALHVLSARIYIEQAQLELADRELEAAGKLDEKNAEAAYLHGILCQRWQKPQEAYEFYCQAAARAPSELAYVLAEAEMLVALDRGGEALALLQAKLADFEHNGVIRDAAGLLWQQEGRYDKAADMFRQAVLLAPDELGFQEHLGLVLYYGGQYQEAGQVLERVVQDKRCARRADLVAAVGECQLQLGRYAEARRWLEQASALDPALPGVWLGLARAALQGNDLQRADLAVRKSLSLEGDSAEAKLMLGYVRLRQGRLNEALAAFRAASTLNADDPLGLCMVGYVLEQMGRAREAIPYYTQALKLKGDDEMARKLLADINLQE